MEDPGWRCRGRRASAVVPSEHRSRRSIRNGSVSSSSSSSSGAARDMFAGYSTSVTKSQLRQLRSIKQSLTLQATKTLVHAFVSSRLDYCNSVLAGVSGQLLHRLQVIQNAAARLVTGVRKYERMTPVLRSLHWLPVRQRITFKF